MTKYFVVALQQNRLVVSKESWIQNPTVNEFSKVFISEDEESDPNFELQTKFYVSHTSDACYNGRIVKQFAKKEDAEKFALWKRPEFFRKGQKRFQFQQSTLVERIDLMVS